MFKLYLQMFMSFQIKSHNWKLTYTNTCHYWTCTAFCSS